MDQCGYDFVIMIKGMGSFVRDLIFEKRGNFENIREYNIKKYEVSGTTVKKMLYAGDEKERYFHIYYPELPVFFSLNFKNADKHWIYWDIEPNNLSENYAQFYNCFFRSIPVFLRNSPH